LALLLALLLHRLYELPDQVAGLPLHLDGLGLVRVVHLEQVLYLPDVGQGTTHELNRALLLLALLLLLTTLLLLLIALRHAVSLPTGNPIASTYPGRHGN
jgi:hypothetical protein